MIWNPDGSTAELSGNGTRIAARWLASRTGAESVRIRVGEREVAARLLAAGLVEQDLGRFTVGGRETVAGIELVPVSVGNPHAVVEGDPDDIQWLGPLLETHPRFPARTNVQVARVERTGQVTARVWERGVGETPASGTGAVAVAAATHGEGDVAVRFPGGELRRAPRGRPRVSSPGPPLRCACPARCSSYIHRVSDGLREFLLLRRQPRALRLPLLAGRDRCAGVGGVGRGGRSAGGAGGDRGSTCMPRRVGFSYELRPTAPEDWAET